MFTIDEATVKLGIIGPFESRQLEHVLHLALNEGLGDLRSPWSLRNDSNNTFAVSYKHESKQGMRLSPSRISGLAYLIAMEVQEARPVYLWADQIALRRIGNNSVKWGNFGLAPYSLFRTILAPQWVECPIGNEHKRMWLRMEAVISVCCQGYVTDPSEEFQTELLSNFRGVIGPSRNGQYPGMRYSPEDALKELAVSVVCGNWDVALVSYAQDKIDASVWAEGVTSKLEDDLAFVSKYIDRLVMRQIFSNELVPSGPYLRRPSEFGVMSPARGHGANILHPPFNEREKSLSQYSNAVGKTVLVTSNIETVFASVDDCGWSLPVGHCGIIRHFNAEELTGEASNVRSLRAMDGMSNVLETVHQAKKGVQNEAARSLVVRVARSEELFENVHVESVIIVSTDQVRLSWRA